MNEQFDAMLTGSDYIIEGVVSPIYLRDYIQAYEFQSLDHALRLVIAMDTKGKWIRVDGTEPYLSGWVDELVDQIALAKH
jgi:hypothetical protein